MAKDLGELKWVEELLPENYLRKHMFGGFAYYVGLQIVMAVFETNSDDPSARSYKNKKYPFDVWNGCLFPVERIHHEKIKKIFPFLVQHPVLTKWMYLPSDSEDFEPQVEKVLAQIRKGSPLFGVIPKPKKKAKSQPNKVGSKTKNSNSRKPMMFR